jgi:hypothetical protein
VRRRGCRALSADASAQYSSQIGAVKKSSNALQQSISEATSQPTATTLGAVADAVRGLSSAVTDLVDAVQKTC